VPADTLSPSMDDTLRARLSEILGKGGVEAGTASIAPKSVELLAAAVRACSAAGTAMRICSGPAGGGPAEDVITVTLSHLQAVELHAPSLTVRAEAGATVAALRTAVEAAHLALAGRLGAGAPGGEHVGSVLANGGATRRLLTGIEAVLATGEHVVTGGRMSKDVAPYDLAAILLGSRGRLGIIVAATFRLVPAGVPLPPHAAAGPVEGGGVDELVRAALDPDGLLAAR
jgi:glycolate oxidase